MFGFRIELPAREEVLPAGEVEEGKGVITESIGTFIIATHSCDLENDQVSDVLLVGVDTAANLGLGKGGLKNIAKGNKPLAYLLPPHTSFGVTDYLVCAFNDLTIVPKKAIQTFIADANEVELEGRAFLDTSKTLFLTPPYREHFASAFAVIFARVALDQNTWERSDFPGA